MRHLLASEQEFTGFTIQPTPCPRLVTGTWSTRFTIVLVVQLYDQEKTHVRKQERRW